MKYTCKNPCFWRGRAWAAGETVDVAAADAKKPENASLCHFDKADEPEKKAVEPEKKAVEPEKKAVEPEKKAVEPADVPPVGEPPAVTEPDAANPGTSARMKMIELLQKNNVAGWNGKTPDEKLRELLKSKGIEFN